MPKTKGLKKLFSQHRLLFTGSFYMLLASVLANIFGYLFQLLMGRMLPAAEYGVLISLLSLLYLTMIPGSTLQATLAKKISELKAGEDFSAIRSLFWVLGRFFLIGGVIWSLVFFVFRQPIAQFLNLSQTSLVIWFGVLAGVSFLQSIPNSFLQGLQRFKAYALSNTLMPFLKLALSTLLVWLGWSVTGALWGLILSMIITIGVALGLLWKNLKGEQVLVNQYFSSMLRFYLPTLLIMIALASFWNLDVILVKHFFVPQEAGLYSALSVLGRIIFFATSSIAMVMFPLVAERKAKGETYLKILSPALGLVLGGSLLITVAYFALPWLIVTIIFGASYLAITPLLGWFGIFISLYTLSFLLVQFYLSIKRLWIAPWLLLTAIIQSILIFFYHDNLAQIVWVNLVSSGLLLTGLLGYLGKLWIKKEVS